MRAMVQLPGYLERVLAGGRDLALVLLPLLNDLRAVRGSALLSEGTLLLLNLKSDRRRSRRPPAPGRAAADGRAVGAAAARALPDRSDRLDPRRARRAEPRDPRRGRHASSSRSPRRQPVFQLWWVIGAVIEALQRERRSRAACRSSACSDSADREIKRLYEQGEARYAQHPPVELLNNLLYYVGARRVRAARAWRRCAPRSG